MQVSDGRTRKYCCEECFWMCFSVAGYTTSTLMAQSTSGGVPVNYDEEQM